VGTVSVAELFDKPVAVSIVGVGAEASAVSVGGTPKAAATSTQANAASHAR
jgi:hypothetical protein